MERRVKPGDDEFGPQNTVGSPSAQIALGGAEAEPVGGFQADRK